MRGRSNGPDFLDLEHRVDPVDGHVQTPVLEHDVSGGLSEEGNAGTDQLRSGTEIREPEQGPHLADDGDLIDGRVPGIVGSGTDAGSHLQLEGKELVQEFGAQHGPGTDYHDGLLLAAGVVGGDVTPAEVEVMAVGLEIGI